MLDPRTPVSDLERLGYEIGQLKDRIEQLAAPSGTMAYRAVEKLTALVEDIQNQLDDYIANGTYNKAQIDAKIASPGAIAPTTVSASGSVSGTTGTFNSGLNSTDVYNHLVTGGGAYRATWTHESGFLGYAPSTRESKTTPEPARFTIEEVLKLEAFFFRYLAMPPYSQELQRQHLGLLAEDTHAAGFPWLVDYDDEGKPFGIRGDVLAAVTLEGLRDLHRRVVALEGIVIGTVEGEPSTDDEEG